MKTCLGCHVEKPETDFYPNKRIRSGLNPRCRECVKAKVNEHRKRPEVRARKRALGRVHYDENRAKYYGQADRWAKRHPTEKRAQRILQQAVRSGHLRRGPCRDCGSTETHGHHPDHRYALEVIWLCAACHRAEDERANRSASQQTSKGGAR